MATKERTTSDPRMKYRKMQRLANTRDRVFAVREKPLLKGHSTTSIASAQPRLRKVPEKGGEKAGE